MLAQRSIHVKVLVGLGLLLFSVIILSSGSLYSTFAYRSLVKDLSWRSDELPLTLELSRRVSELRLALGELRGLRAARLRNIMEVGRIDAGRIAKRMSIVGDKFRSGVTGVVEAVSGYRDQLDGELHAGSLLADNQSEWATLENIETTLARIRKENDDSGWLQNDATADQLDEDVETLERLSDELPRFLYGKIHGIRDDVHAQYRTLFAVASITSAVAASILGLLVWLSRQWIFGPLGVLISGSRKVAAGNFGFRIFLESNDEMGELARALNGMTARFQAIRDDLDRQVQERTKQVVRNEQLASVGFLAAGVAHEINNPLASIAMCAESLEGRLAETLDCNNPEQKVVADYLRMIQSEAFRCKGITEKLLDFSRVGQVKRMDADIGDLAQDVVEMVGHLGKYQRKELRLSRPSPAVVSVNPQEIKQVVLNLLTNALDSVDDGGLVGVEIGRRDGCAELDVTDNGCGITPDVLERVFEPFFTRRREGQGTGLGLSISYRIVADHGGTIEAHSAGPGRGARFRVRLPLAESQKEVLYQYRAA